MVRGRSIYRKCLSKLLILIGLIALPFITIAVILLLSLPIGLFRRFVGLAAKIFRKDLRELVDPKSLVFGLEEVPDPRANEVAYFLFDGPIDILKFKRDISKKILFLRNTDGSLAYPELQERLVKWGGFYFWSKTPQGFDISSHFQVFSPPPHPSSAKIGSVKLIEEMLRTSLVTPFQPNRSPWKIKLYPNFSENKTLMIIKFHHGLGDGLSFLKIIGKLSSSEMRFDETSRAVSKLSELTSTKTLRERMRDGLGQVRKMVRLPYDLLEELVESFDWFEPGNPWEKVKLSNDYFVTLSEELRVTDFKGLKNKYQISFVGAMLGVLTGAIRRCLLEDGKSIPRKLHVLAPFPKPNHPDLKLANHFAAAYLTLPLGESDALERLNLIDRNLRNVQGSSRLLVYPTLSLFLGGLPPGWIKYVGSNFISFGNLSIIAVPGLFSLGNVECPEIGYCFGTLCGCAGIGFSMGSYNGKIRLVSVVDKAMWSEGSVRRLNDFMVQEMKFLRTGSYDESSELNH